MSEKMIENNKVSVIGEVVSEFTFSHEVFGEGFYIADLAVSRLSDQVDVIPLMISERLLDVSKDYRGMTMEAIGQFRSYNRHEGAKNRLVLSVFVREIGVGSHVCVWGRVQSREYTKKLSETECEKRVAYEVSVSKLECVEE